MTFTMPLLLLPSGHRFKQLLLLHWSMKYYNLLVSHCVFLCCLCPPCLRNPTRARILHQVLPISPLRYMPPHRISPWKAPSQLGPLVPNLDSVPPPLSSCLPLLEPSRCFPSHPSVSQDKEFGGQDPAP